MRWIIETMAPVELLIYEGAGRCLKNRWFGETREGLQARVSVNHRGGSTGSRAFTLAWRSAGCCCKNRFLTRLSSIVSRYFNE